MHIAAEHRSKIRLYTLILLMLMTTTTTPTTRIRISKFFQVDVLISMLVKHRLIKIGKHRKIKQRTPDRVEMVIIFITLLGTVFRKHHIRLSVCIRNNQPMQTRRYDCPARRKLVNETLPVHDFSWLK